MRMKAVLTTAAFLLVAASPAIAQKGQGQMPVPLMDPAKLPGTTVNPGASAARLTPEQIAAHVSRYGNVLSKAAVGVGGLTAWTVEKSGKTMVLYTTEDGQALMAGLLWDTASGANLSDHFATGAKPSASAAVAREPLANPSIGAINGKAKVQDLPESIRTVDGLAGVKEGKGDAANTLYVVFDTRCPYCRKAYNATRKYVAKGFTVKWIPANALGDPANGTPIAAALLKAPAGEQPALLKRALGDYDKSVRAVATPEIEKALQTNLDFLMAVFQNNGQGAAGVPVGFFYDHRHGTARMLKGISENVVLDEIFGRVQ